MTTNSEASEVADNIPAPVLRYIDRFRAFANCYGCIRGATEALIDNTLQQIEEHLRHEDLPAIEAYLYRTPVGGAETAGSESREESK